MQNAGAWGMRQRVLAVMDGVQATDMHTHIYGPEFGELLLWGVDELLRHHYLIAEALRWGGATPEQFYGLTGPRQAEFVWKTLFVDHTPISASALGVLETFRALGIDTSIRDLASIRSSFGRRSLDAHISQVLHEAKLDSVVMTNDPLDATERAVWEHGLSRDSRFHAALRLDSLFLNFETNVPCLRDLGYAVEPGLDTACIQELRRFLQEWTERTDALYLALSLPPEWRYPDQTQVNRLLEECALPVASRMGRPFALMIGARRQVNPALGLAGDSAGRSDVASLERLCAAHGGNRFLVTMLSRENQYALCVAARKFPNLMPFGCWWFLNIPYLIDEMTRMRLELVGTSVIPHHSDVRILEQVIPKWAHARSITADALGDMYAAVEETGRKVTDAEIRRDVQDMFSDNFWRLTGRF